LGLLTLPVAVMTVARLGLLPVNANTSASYVEASFAHMALDASAARRPPHLADPIAPWQMLPKELGCGGRASICGCRADVGDLHVSFIPVLFGSLCAALPAGDAMSKRGGQHIRDRSDVRFLCRLQ
jgi:hypothetical protein